MLEAQFLIRPTDAVATAGSCFAQHIGRALIADGFNYLLTEAPAGEVAFSARYGNIYTALQLRQLAQQAYALFEPSCGAWRRPDGRWVDPFRPREFPDGFATVDDIAVERARHLQAVRQAFERCAVFVFTLGLTETWVADADGAAVPLPPGVMAAPPDGAAYSFRNLDVMEIEAEFGCFLSILHEVNPSAKVLLTVSPVPLSATFERRHVLVSNALSKARLRVAADLITRKHDSVFYFPSYEIITADPRVSSFEEDGRSVSPAAVARVMAIFRRQFCAPGAMVADAPSSHVCRPRQESTRASPAIVVSSSEFRHVVCDEEALAL